MSPDMSDDAILPEAYEMLYTVELYKKVDGKMYGSFYDHTVNGPTREFEVPPQYQAQIPMMLNMLRTMT